MNICAKSLRYQCMVRQETHVLVSGERHRKEFLERAYANCTGFDFVVCSPVIYPYPTVVRLPDILQHACVYQQTVHTTSIAGALKNLIHITNDLFFFPWIADEVSIPAGLSKWYKTYKGNYLYPSCKVCKLIPVV